MRCYRKKKRLNKEFPPGKSEQKIFFGVNFFFSLSILFGGMPTLLRCRSQCRAYEREQQQMLVDGVEVRCGADDCPGADELMDGPDPEDVMWDEVKPQIAEEWMKEQKQKHVEDSDEDEDYIPSPPEYDTVREMVQAQDTSRS
jgi:hypothetical protein